MATQFTHGRALVIGIANYPSISKLPEKVLDDARDVAALLQSAEYCGYPAENVEVLLDAQATADGIRAALTRLTQAAGAGDTAIVFFSGHGGRVESGPEAGAYLLPFDCDPKRLLDTALSASEVTMWLSGIKAGRLVVLLDACHSAGTGDLKSLDPTVNLKAGLDEKTYADLAKGTGRVIMASSRSTEVSLILSGMKNSLFTHYLLEALRGAANVRGDGMVRVLDVFHYVSDKVPTRAPQHPIFKADDLEGNFALTLDRGGKKIAPPVSDTTAARPAKLSGKARIEIRKGLVTRWEDLATYFEVPLADRSTFGQGANAAGKMLDWLEERKKLPALRDAFNYFGWDDLIKELDTHPT
jgi:hypothetical protein